MNRSLLFCTCLLFPTFTFAQDAANKSKFAITDPAQAGIDFAYQGEYSGFAQFPADDSGTRGLQVVALGDGNFQAVEYRNGLPGEGGHWSNSIQYTGTLDGEFLRFRNEERSVTVRNGFAVIRDPAGRQLGFLSKVQRVSPSMGLAPPPDATVLFNGKLTDHLVNAKLTPDGQLDMGFDTKEPFGDFRLHVEFRLPFMPYATGQARGNSGVYVQGRYEVQILDSFGLEGAFNECGSLYRTRPPELNMCFPPLSWQTYDIYFTAARFNASGEKTSNARFTVLLNGVSVQSDIELQNKTGAGQKEGPDPRPIKFQNHGNPVSYRNLWILPGSHRPTISSPGTSSSVQCWNCR